MVRFCFFNQIFVAAQIQRPIFRPVLAIFVDKLLLIQRAILSRDWYSQETNMTFLLNMVGSAFTREHRSLSVVAAILIYPGHFFMPIFNGDGTCGEYCIAAYYCAAHL
jgi:hypothetical protein